MTMQHPIAPTDPTSRPTGLLNRVANLSALLWDEAVEADAAAEVTPRAWQALHDSGLAMAPFPGALGGDDLLAPDRHEDLVTVLRRLGRADLSMARLYEGHANAVALVRRYGTQDQLRRLAERVQAGALSGVWGAEDAQGLQATGTPEGLRLKGRKILASGAGFLTDPLVTATAGDSPILLWLHLEPGERADLTRWTAQGMRSSATGSIELGGLVLPADQVVGGLGDFMRQPHFSGGAWRFCAVHLGAAECLVDLFRAEILSRDRAGDPYQLQRIAQCTAAVTTAGFWVHEAARRLAREADDTEMLVAFVNLTRSVTERACLDVLEAVHRGVGLKAFVRPNPIERVSRDLSTYLRQPVPDLAMADGARAVLASQRPTGALWSVDP